MALPFYRWLTFLYELGPLNSLLDLRLVLQVRIRHEGFVQSGAKVVDA